MYANRTHIGNWLSLSQEAERNLKRHFIYRIANLILLRCYWWALERSVAKGLRGEKTYAPSRLSNAR